MHSSPEAPFVIRPATADDTDAIIAVIRNVYHEYGFIFEAAEETPDLLALARTYDGQRGRFFVGLRAGALIGTAGVRLHDAEQAEIVRLYLDSVWRGRGYGYRLLQAVVDWAQRRGARQVLLWSDSRFADAHRLYTRFGFMQRAQRQLQDVNHSLEYQFLLDLPA